MTWRTQRSTILQNFIALCQPTSEISVTKYPADTHTHTHTQTSTPVVRTDVYPHMPIAVTANSLQHWPSASMRRPVCHTVLDGRASLSHRANRRWTCYRFSIFDLGGLPLGPRSPKGEMTYYPRRSTILQNFSPIAQTVYEICVTIVFFTFWPLGG